MHSSTNNRHAMHHSAHACTQHAPPYVQAPARTRAPDASQEWVDHEGERPPAQLAPYHPQSPLAEAAALARQQTQGKVLRTLAACVASRVAITCISRSTSLR